MFAPTAASSYYTTAQPAAATEPGAIDSCGLYYTVVSGDTCNTMALRYGITFQDLLDYNTGLNSDCINLWVAYSVWVAPVSSGPPSTDGTCGPDNATRCVTAAALVHAVVVVDTAETATSIAPARTVFRVPVLDHRSLSAPMAPAIRPLRVQGPHLESEC